MPIKASTDRRTGISPPRSSQVAQTKGSSLRALPQMYSGTKLKRLGESITLLNECKFRATRSPWRGFFYVYAFVKTAILVLAIFAAVLAPPRQVRAEEPPFEQINDQTAIASLATSREFISWFKRASDVWLPLRSDVQAAKELLHSADGQRQLIAIGGPKKYSMQKCIESLAFVSVTKFQVFGVVTYGRQGVLIEVFPWDKYDQVNDGDRWTREIEITRIYDGGTSFWWVLYDLDGKCFVDCGHNWN